MHENDIVADPEKRENVERRLWAKVAVGGENDCWLWQAKARWNSGYGKMSAGRGVYLRTHRMVYALTHGALPESMYVCHSCDTPACCNPRHLFLGTPRDNMTDKKTKGRGTKPPAFYGDAHHNTKFDEATARKIAADKRSARLVAADFNVSEKTVYRLRWKQSWKQLWAAE